LLHPHENALAFFLTRRTSLVATHKDQVSFPGGAQEDGETPIEAALRETCEEIGVCRDDIEIVGALTTQVQSQPNQKQHDDIGNHQHHIQMMEIYINDEHKMNRRFNKR